LVGEAEAEGRGADTHSLGVVRRRAHRSTESTGGSAPATPSRQTRAESSVARGIVGADQSGPPYLAPLPSAERVSDSPVQWGQGMWNRVVASAAAVKRWYDPSAMSRDRFKDWTVGTEDTDIVGVDRGVGRLHVHLISAHKVSCCLLLHPIRSVPFKLRGQGVDGVTWFWVEYRTTLRTRQKGITTWHWRSSRATPNTPNKRSAPTS